MRASITGSFALLLLCVGGVDAQQSSRLQMGPAVPATLAADGTLRYELNLPNKHFVAGRVDQDGVDATVTITGPAGKRVLRAARIGRGGPETFAFATDTAGRYLIACRSVSAAADVQLYIGPRVDLATVGRLAVFGMVAPLFLGLCAVVLFALLSFLRYRSRSKSAVG